MEFIQQAIDFLTSASGMSATIAITLDFVFRLFPSSKPLSIVHLVAAFVKLLAEALTKLSELLDKVLPQKIKEE